VSARIPLSVIGGYLGAGKTTLINRILTGDHGRRVAVIVNDFGDISIDESLLGPAVGGVRALANGCVCCAAVDGLASALEEVGALDPAPEHVIIEVSGVGDPWAVAQWGRTPRYELEGVVVVADPGEIERWIDDAYVGDTVRRQLTAADLIVISRDDVASEDEVGAAKDVVERFSDATIVVGSALALALLLGLDTTGSAPDGSHGAHSARTFIPAEQTRDGLEGWLRSAPRSVVRVKGFVRCEGDTVLAQRAGQRVEISRREHSEDPQLTVITSMAAVPAEVDAWIEALG
jgi:G3E family GTPase